MAREAENKKFVQAVTVGRVMAKTIIEEGLLSEQAIPGFYDREEVTRLAAELVKHIKKS